MQAIQEDWLTDRVAYLKGLKSPNAQQALLVLLAEKPNRDAHEEKKLAVLVRAEKAAIRAAKARQDAATMMHAEKRAAREEQRRVRNHRLILQGILFDLAGLENRSRGELLGLLITAASTTAEEKWAAWKRVGDARLAESPESEGEPDQ